MTDEALKKELQSMLKRYEGNSGMAGMICGRPVELMSESEQNRLFNGFCTTENLKIMTDSRERLKFFLTLDLSEQESEKLNKAIQVLGDLLKDFTDYSESKINRSVLREKVRKILFKPLAHNTEELIEAVSKLMEMVNFLATQDPAARDSWDLMIDCTQMHDVLCRIRDCCGKLQVTDSEKPTTSEPGSLSETVNIAKDSITFLEHSFQSGLDADRIQRHFEEISGALNEIWSS